MLAAPDAEDLCPFAGRAGIRTRSDAETLAAMEREAARSGSGLAVFPEGDEPSLGARFPLAADRETGFLQVGLRRYAWTSFGPRETR